jgi:hypothetical protein
MQLSFVLICQFLGLAVPAAEQLDLGRAVLSSSRQRDSLAADLLIKIILTNVFQ